MTIAVGDKIPDVKVQVPGPDGPAAGPDRGAARSREGRAVRRAGCVHARRAATTTCRGSCCGPRTCRRKGVDPIACVAVNDAFVMKAWGEANEVGEKVTLVADGSAVFTKALGLDVDLTGGGLGIRSKRYAAILRTASSPTWPSRRPWAWTCSSADAVLAKL